MNPLTLLELTISKNVDAYTYRFDIIYGAPVEIVHHILIYSCTLQEINGYTAGPVLTSASPCSGGIVFGWAIGSYIFLFTAISLTMLLQVDR